MEKENKTLGTERCVNIVILYIKVDKIIITGITIIIIIRSSVIIVLLFLFLFMKTKLIAFSIINFMKSNKEVNECRNKTITG